MPAGGPIAADAAMGSYLVAGLPYRREAHFVRTMR